MQDLHTYLEMLHLSEGESHRGDCPSCGKRNTFGVHKTSGDIVYNCFSNSCGIKGVKTGRRDLTTLKNILGKTKVKVEHGYSIPQHFIRGLSTPEALDWVVKHNAYPAYQQGLYEIYTDIRQDRIVVPLYSPDGRLVNAGGRAWSRYTVPKFRIYSSDTPVYPFVVGSSTKVCIVEDFASAAALAGHGITGVALLGTNPKYQLLIPVLKKLNPTKIIVALDADATGKAIKLTKFLQFIFNCAILHPLDKDIKDMNEKELEQCLTNM